MTIWNFRQLSNFEYFLRCKDWPHGPAMTHPITDYMTDPMTYTMINTMTDSPIP